MRPYIKFHDDAQIIANYVLRPGAEWLGGTIIKDEPEELIKELQDLISPSPAPKPIMHVTLSMPAGLKAPAPLWRRIFATTLNMLGLDPEAMPWLMARHTDTEVDHAHAIVSTVNFVGQPIPVKTSPSLSMKIHQRLCKLLGLDDPPYFQPELGQRLDPVTPARNLTPGPTTALHEALSTVMTGVQPESLEELNKALALRPEVFQGVIKANSFNRQSIEWQSPDARLFGGELGKAWEPRFLLGRLKHAAALRHLRNTIGLSHLAQLLNSPSMKEHLHEAQITLADDRTGTPAEGLDGGDPQDGHACAVSLPAPRPSEPARGPAGGTYRTPDQPDEQPSRNPEGHSGRAERAQSGASTDLSGTDAAPRTDRSSADAPDTHARDDHEGPRPDDRLTVGKFIKRVVRLAKEVSPDCQVTWDRNANAVKVSFPDTSAILVAPQETTILIDGALAEAFYGVMHKEFQSNPDTEDDHLPEPW